MENIPTTDKENIASQSRPLVNEETCIQLAPDFSKRLNLTDDAKSSYGSEVNRQTGGLMANTSDSCHAGSAEKDALQQDTCSAPSVGTVHGNQLSVSGENPRALDKSDISDTASNSTLPVSQATADVPEVTGTGRQQYVCKCGARFDRSTCLANHKRWACELKEKTAQCEECKTWFASVRGLRRHMRQVHGGATKCDKCGVRCRNNIQLTRHWLDAHCEDTEGCTDNLKCFKCERTDFKDKYDLECHLLRHKYDRRKRRLSQMSAPKSPPPSSECGQDQSAQGIAVAPPTVATSTGGHQSTAAAPMTGHQSISVAASQLQPQTTPHRAVPQCLPHGATAQQPPSHAPPVNQFPLPYWYAAASAPLPPHFQHPPHFLHPPPPPHLHPHMPFFMTPHSHPESYLSSPQYDKGTPCNTQSNSSEPSISSAQAPRHDHEYIEPTTLPQWPPHRFQPSAPRHPCGHKGKMKWKKYLKLIMKGIVPPLGPAPMQQIPTGFYQHWANSPHHAEETVPAADGERTSEYKIACKFCDKVIERKWISWHQKKECPVLSFHRCGVCHTVFRKRHLLLKHMQEQNHYNTSATPRSDLSTEINPAILAKLQKKINDTLTFDTDNEPVQNLSSQRAPKQVEQLENTSNREILALSHPVSNSIVLHGTPDKTVENMTSTGVSQPTLFKCSICKVDFSSAIPLRTHLREHLDQVETVQKVRDWRHRSADFFRVANSEDDFVSEESVSVADSEITSTTGSALTVNSSTFSSLTTSTCTDDRWMKHRRRGGSHRHRQRCHRKGEISICEFCGDHFVFQKDLEIHMAEKHPKSKLQCPVCHKNFSWKKRGKFYERHMESHYGVKIFKHKCEHCEKTFLEKSKLQAHIAAVHTQEQLHTCGICGKSYANKSSLVRHERLHTGARPYKCDVCSETFLEKRELLRHSATHTGVAPFSCDECGQGFTLKTSLTAHKKNKHPAS